MDWKHIVSLDPFLAGAIAARGYEWYDKANAEQQADSVGLSGEARAKFLEGWHYELELAGKERKEQAAREGEAMAREGAKGDPAR